jgi:hypothetical protein
MEKSVKTTVVTADKVDGQNANGIPKISGRKL